MVLVAFYIDGDMNFRYRHWSSSISEASSNYRDLRVLVEEMEEHVRNSKVWDCEDFLLTDNLMAEYSFYKGSLLSETSFNLILRLRKLELEGEIILHVIHVLERRMIISGVDALSRGDARKGIMEGNSLRSYFPFYLESD